MSAPGGVGVGARWRANPFFVLGLPPTASRAEVERAGQKLIAQLELGVTSAATYTTPLGPVPRTAEGVRTAVTQLRDPAGRLLHELWATPIADPVGER